MPISFDQIMIGKEYSRPTLAQLWGYAGYAALARGVVTPKDDTKIILFVTCEKQQSAEQYIDHLHGDLLDWEGPTDHFAESRMLATAASGEEIHVFYRQRHHSDFTYEGVFAVIQYQQFSDQPSTFQLRRQG